MWGFYGKSYNYNPEDDSLASGHMYEQSGEEKEGGIGVSSELRASVSSCE